MSKNYRHADLAKIRVKGKWLTPEDTLRGLNTGAMYIGDIQKILWASGDWSWAKAWQTEPNGFRIGAGVYGTLTVLTQH